MAMHTVSARFLPCGHDIPHTMKSIHVDQSRRRIYAIARYTKFSSDGRFSRRRRKFVSSTDLVKVVRVFTVVGNNSIV